MKVQEVSRKLGARYVLEGSVRKIGERVRLTAQLIDAVQDHHLWSERYDRPLQDLVTVQDEIRHKIVTTQVPQLTLAGGRVLSSKGSDADRRRATSGSP